MNFLAKRGKFETQRPVSESGLLRKAGSGNSQRVNCVGENSFRPVWKLLPEDGGAVEKNGERMHFCHWN